MAAGGWGSSTHAAQEQQQATVKKEAGNAAFRAGNFAAAVAAYTEALVAASADESLMRADLLSNRAAARLALQAKPTIIPGRLLHPGETTEMTMPSY